MRVEDIILLEDSHLLVVDKPAGLSCLPNEGMEDMLTIIKEYIKQRDEKKGNVFLQPVHRLDKDVSGILVFAKTSKALSRLNEQIREKQWKKTYFAKLSGKLPNQEGTLTHYLCKRKFHADVYLEKRAFAKEATLHYKLIKDNIYQIELITGRYHQIRAQLSFMKCPIVGDKKYGSANVKSNRLHLHHAHLIFYHPVTKEEITLDSKPIFL